MSAGEIGSVVWYLVVSLALGAAVIRLAWLIGTRKGNGGGIKDSSIAD